MLLGKVDSVIRAVGINRFIGSLRLSPTPLVRVLPRFCFEFVYMKTYMQMSFHAHLRGTYI